MREPKQHHTGKTLIMHFANLFFTSVTQLKNYSCVSYPIRDEKQEDEWDEGRNAA
jgi:hypothetical protein